MLLQGLRWLCLAPGGAGSILTCFRVLVSLTSVSGRFIYGFQMDFHFVDQL